MTPRRPVLAVGAVALAALAVVGVLSTRWEPSSQPLGDRPDKVLVFGMAPLGFGDLGRGDTPVLDRLIRTEAVAALSVRTGARLPTLREGYLSFGAGSRAFARSGTDLVLGGDEPYGPGTASQALAALTGRRAEGAIAAVGAASVVERNLAADVPTPPGTLGQALRRAGLRSAAVGNADRPSPFDPAGGVRSRPAALSVMDRDLTVAAGELDPAVLLTPDPGAPFGVRADADATVEAITDALAEADVVVADPGDLSRAERFRAPASLGGQGRARRMALRSTDAILGRILTAVDERTLVMVVSVMPPGSGYRLTPLVLTGPGVPEGWAVSPSTKRQGLVAITDLAPTILSALGVEPPSDLPGNPVRYQAGPSDVDALHRLDLDTNRRERSYYGHTVAFILAEAVAVALAALVAFGRGRSRWLALLAPHLLVAVAAAPLASLLVRLLPVHGDAALALEVVLAVGAALLAGLDRRSPIRPLAWVLGASVAAIVVDACTGSTMHLNSWLGYSPHGAGRFYGIPNTTFAVLASATLILAGVLVAERIPRSAAVASALALLAVVAVVDGSPTMGGDVGGILTLVPVFAVTGVALAGRRIRVGVVAAVGTVTAAVLGLATAVDLSRPAERRTHLGRFAGRFVEGGPSTLVDTVIRKEAANLRILQRSVWTWLAVVVAVALVGVLGSRARRDALLPPGHPLRIVVIACLVGSALGFVTNDSGPLVLALFWAFLPAVVLLRALGQSPPGLDAAPA